MEEGFGVKRKERGSKSADEVSGVVGGSGVEGEDLIDAVVKYVCMVQ